MNLVKTTMLVFLGRSLEGVLRDARREFGSRNEVVVIARDGDRLPVPEGLTAVAVSQFKPVQGTFDINMDRVQYLLVGNGGTTSQLVPTILELERSGAPFQVWDLQREGAVLLDEKGSFVGVVRTLEGVLEQVQKHQQEDPLICPRCFSLDIEWNDYEENHGCGFCSNYVYTFPGKVVNVFGHNMPIDLLDKAAREEGVAYLAGPIEEAGRKKIILGAASPEMIKFFIDEMELIDKVGDPENGIAHGFLPQE